MSDLRAELLSECLKPEEIIGDPEVYKLTRVKPVE